MYARLPWKIATMSFMGLLVCVLATSVAAIIGDFDLGGEIDLADESGIYVTVISRYFGHDCQQVRQWSDLCPDTDDLAVIMFISETTGKSPAYLLALRGQDLSWWEISQGMNVNPNDWFTPVRVAPRPPYDKVYRNWVAASESDNALVLSDADCRNLVAAKFLHRIFAVSIARAMEMRATGKKLKNLCADEVRRRQDNSKRNKKELAGNSAS